MTTSRQRRHDLTDSEWRAVCAILRLVRPPYGAVSINARELTRELGVSVTTLGVALRKLRAAGAVRVTPRGRAGTLIEVLDRNVYCPLRGESH